jgi:hypothetical protein
VWLGRRRMSLRGRSACSDHLDHPNVTGGVPVKMPYYPPFQNALNLM